MKSKNLYSPKNLVLTEQETKKQYSIKEFLRQIDINKPKLKKIEALLHGTYTSKTTGSGFDFNEIREYKVGDDLRHISWKATAKTGVLQTKEYYAEKEVRSYFLIDTSNSMFCGKKSESFIQLTAFLLELACTFSEKIGGVFFKDKITYQFLQAQANSQANVIFHTLLEIFHAPNKTLASLSSTNLYKALEFTNKYFCKKGIIFIVSDFVNLTGWEKAMYETVQKHNVYSFQIYDPIDFKLPKAGYITIIDPETNKRFFVNTDNMTLTETYSKLTSQKQEKLKSFLHTIGVRHMVIEKDDF